MSAKRSHKSIKKKRCRVLSVYDGDTVTVEWEERSWFGLKKDLREIKVRLAYVDTPELRDKEEGAREAKDLLEKLLRGKHVLLEYETMADGSPREGDYDRLLAVLHLQRILLPNLNVNEWLLKKGLAELYKNPDNITPHHVKRFHRAERYARERDIGIWGYADRKKPVGGMFWYVLGGICIGVVLTIFWLA